MEIPLMSSQQLNTKYPGWYLQKHTYSCKAFVQWRGIYLALLGQCDLSLNCPVLPESPNKTLIILLTCPHHCTEFAWSLCPTFSWPPWGRWWRPESPGQLQRGRIPDTLRMKKKNQIFRNQNTLLIILTYCVGRCWHHILPNLYLPPESSLKNTYMLPSFDEDTF